MARSLHFEQDGNTYETPIVKLDRDKIYGRVEKKYFDRDGNPCYFGSVSDDGMTIFGREAFEYGYRNGAGEWLERNDLTMVDIDNQPLQKHESSFKTAIVLDRTVSIDDYLSHIAKSVYQLEASPELVAKVENAEGIFYFQFNYNATFVPSDAFLIVNDGNLFMVVAEPTGFDFIEQAQIDSPLVDDSDDDEEDEDDIDFSMF